MDANHTYVQVATSRVRWIKLLPYEINVDKVSTTITNLPEEDIDKSATSFKNYEQTKSRITIDMKKLQFLGRRTNLLKKLKEIFGKGEEEEEEEGHDEEEEEQVQDPFALTQGQGDDLKEDVESVEGEEAKEALKDTKAKKRKAKEKRVEKQENPMKKPQQKPTVPSTRVAAIQAKEVAKPKGKRSSNIVEPSELVKKSYKRLKNKLELKPNYDEEETRLDDMSQFKVVSHNPSSDLDNLCDNIK